MAKQTINNDIKERKKYQEASFVEFLEFFARLAMQKFQSTPNRPLTLQQQIEMLMDVSFPLVNMARKEVAIETEYVSVSEDDLIEDKYFIWIYISKITE